jgi:hypothetical protein
VHCRSVWWEKTKPAGLCLLAPMEQWNTEPICVREWVPKYFRAWGGRSHIRGVCGSEPLCV